MLNFMLGAHHPGWLSVTRVPLFVSHRRLKDYKTLPKALVHGGYAVDSGGFSELSMFGEWRTTAREYVRAIARYDTEIGHMSWCAPMDWMCEPFMLGLTGATIFTHQRRTVANFVELTALWPEHSDEDVPFMPVLQGWALDDYMACWDLYEESGVDLSQWPVVGVGSVCRRQATAEIGHILAALKQRDPGIPLHGFGVKTAGLAAYGHLLDSADSMAWSYNARRRPPLPGCTTHKNCANCLKFALQWRERVIAGLDGPQQLDLLAHEEAA